MSVLGFDLADHVDHVRQRTLQDALIEATSEYWLRRADDFERVGNAECDLVALACRRHAALLARTTDISPSREISEEVVEALQGAS